jgi:hypothetical protein
MMKCMTMCCAVTAAALISTAAAQNSNVHSSLTKSTTSTSSAQQTTNKPLTPKSAMPSPRKSSGAVPKSSGSSAKANVELTHLERQGTKTAPEKNASPAAAKTPKSSGTSAGNGSGINATYQKPAGGLRANTPDPNAANGSKTRVTKKN